MSTGQWLATVGGGGTTPFWQILARNSLSGASDTLSVTSGWVEVAGASSTKNFTLDTGNSELDCKFYGSSSNGNGSVVHYDLGSGEVSDTTWTLQYTINYSAQSGNQGIAMVGLFDETTASDNAQDGIYTVFMNGDNFVNANGINGATPNDNWGTANTGATLSNGTDYYVTLKRTSATAATLDIKTGSHSGSSITNFPASATNISSSVSGLRYIKVLDRKGYSGTAGDVATIKDMKVWVDSNDTSTDPTKEFDFSSTENLIDKPYMMVLMNEVASGQTDLRETFNSDGGSGGSTQYAWRMSANGATDSTAINTYGMNLEEVYHTQSFIVQYLSNTDSIREKLVSSISVVDGSAGAGTSPSRVELAGKWIDTSSVTSVDLTNIDSGDMTTGSEIVVLGYDATDSSGTTAWEELASVDLSGGAATTLSSGTFTPKKYLMIQAFCDAASGATDRKLIVGTGGSIDTGGNYSRRRADNGTDSASASSSRIMSLADGAAAGEFFVEGFFTNVSSREKMFIGQGVTQGTAGAGNAPSRTEAVGKWANTSGQINIINIVADANMGTKTRLTVWGFD